MELLSVWHVCFHMYSYFMFLDDARGHYVNNVVFLCKHLVVHMKSTCISNFLFLLFLYIGSPYVLILHSFLCVMFYCLHILFLEHVFILIFGSIVSAIRLCIFIYQVNVCIYIYWLAQEMFLLLVYYAPGRMPTCKIISFAIYYFVAYPSHESLICVIFILIYFLLTYSNK